MTTLLIAGAIALVALAVAAIAQQRKPDVPTAPSHSVPEQLDRSDFAHGSSEWLLAVFTSATCHSCAKVVKKAKAAASGSADVAFQELEVVRDKALHDRYNIDAVPTTVLVDGSGVVQVSFLGPIPQDGLVHAMADIGLHERPDDQGGTAVQIN